MSNIKINVLISNYSLVIDITKYVYKFRAAILYSILPWNFKTESLVCICTTRFKANLCSLHK